jgi:hypothetical protein
VRRARPRRDGCGRHFFGRNRCNRPFGWVGSTPEIAADAPGAFIWESSVTGCMAGAVLEVHCGLRALALPAALAALAVPLGELWSDGRGTDKRLFFLTALGRAP